MCSTLLAQRLLTAMFADYEVDDLGLFYYFRFTSQPILCCLARSVSDAWASLETRFNLGPVEGG